MRELLVSLTGIVAALLLAGALSLARLPYLGFALRGDRVAAVDAGSHAGESGLRIGDRIVGAYADSPAGTGPVAREIPVDRLEGLSRGTSVGLIIHREAATQTVFFVVSDPPRPEAVRRILTFLTAVTFLLVGLFTFAKRPDALGRTFLLLCLSFALILRAPLPAGPPLIRAVESIVNDLAGFLLAASFIHFVLLFPPGRPIGARHTRILTIVYGLGATLVAASIFFTAGPPVVPELALAFGGLAALYVGGAILLALAIFVRSIRATEDPEQKLRFRVVQWGTILGLAPFALTILLRNLVPGGGLPGDQYAVLSVWILPLAYMYAIVRHQIFDIRIIVRRGVVYFLVTTCMALIYFTAVVFLGPRLDPGEGHPTVAILSLLVIALAFTGTRNTVQAFVDRAFFPRDAGRRRRLEELSSQVAVLLDSDRLETSLLDELFERLEASHGALYVLPDDAKQLVLRALRDGTPGSDAVPAGGEQGQAPPPDILPFPPALRDAVDDLTGPATRSDLVSRVDGEHHDAFRDRLDELGFDLFLPIRDGLRLHAVVALRLASRDGQPDSQELAILEHIVQDASRALTQALRREDEMEREKISSELAVARSIQEHLLPGEPPLSPLVEMAGVTLPCDAVGGDAHDYVQLPDGRVGFCVSDVSGKGVPAAILTASLQASFRATAATGAGPGALLETLNRRLHEVAEPDRFACLFYALIHPQTMVMRYANAGLEPPLLIRRRAPVCELREGGPILGVIAGAEYEEGRVTLAAGDTVVCFSDGLVDAKTEEEIPLNRRSILRIVRKNPDLSAESLKRALMSAAGISQVTPVPDDVTILVARIY